jgi:hypothetical protein
LGLALFTDYRGLTTWHARQTMPLRELRREPEDSRQYRLERYWIGGSFALVGCVSAVVFLGVFVYALF